MNKLEKYQADVEAAQKLLERAIISFEEAKKQEKEATAINRNLFNKQTKKLPKKFVMDVYDAKYNCHTDGDILTCVYQNTEYTYKYDITEDEHIIELFMSDEWVITTIFDDKYDSESDNPVTNNSVFNNSSFDNCYINVGAFAKKHNISLETAHYLIQPWLFSMGHSWGIFMGKSVAHYLIQPWLFSMGHTWGIFRGKSVAHVAEEFLVFDEGRICREDEDYLEERDELCLSYSPVDGITYVIVPFKAPFVKPKTKRTGWINVYKYEENSCAACIYNTKEIAIKKGGGDNHVDTVEISWEE